MYANSVTSMASRLKIVLAASICAFTTISSAVAMLGIQVVAA